MPVAKRGSPFTYPSQGRGLLLSGQTQHTENHAQSRHCSAPPALFLVRVGPGAPQSRIWTTHTPGQVSDPGLHSTRPSSVRSPRGFHCTQALGPVATHLTPGFVSLGGLLEILSHSWVRKKKLLEIKPELQPHVRPDPSDHTCSLHLAGTTRPIFCNYEPLMGEGRLADLDKPAFIPSQQCLG